MNFIKYGIEEALALVKQGATSEQQLKRAFRAKMRKETRNDPFLYASDGKRMRRSIKFDKANKMAVEEGLRYFFEQKYL